VCGHRERAVVPLAARDDGAVREPRQHGCIFTGHADLEADDLLGADAALQRGGRVERDDLAVVDDRDAVTELVGLLHVVRRQEDRASLTLQLPDAIAQVTR